MSENDNQDSDEIRIDDVTTVLPPEPSKNLPVTRGRRPTFITPEEHKLIDDAVQKINDIKYNTIYNAYSEIGKYILDTFFKGKPKLAASRDPKKPDSFNKLCMRKDLAFSASTLSRMLRVACFENELEAARIDHKNIPFTHKAILIRIEDPEERVKKFEEISQSQVSSRELEITLKKEFKKPKSKEYDANNIHDVMNRIKSVVSSLGNINISVIEKWIEKPNATNNIDLELYTLTNDIADKLDKFTILCENINGCKEKTSKMKRPSAKPNK